MYSMRPSARIGCCRGCGRAAPGTCRGRSRSNSNCRSNSNRGHSVGGRGGSGCGGRRKYVPVGLAGIHAADTPATGPTPPSTDLRNLLGWHDLLLVGVDLGRHVDPRHAWMLFNQLSKCSISMEIHPRMAWIYPIAEICQRWGGVGLRGVRGMDAAAKPTGTYLRRPRNPTPPRHPTECPLLLLPLLRPLRVPGAARPESLTLPAWRPRSRRRSLHAVTAPLRGGRCRRWRRE